MTGPSSSKATWALSSADRPRTQPPLCGRRFARRASHRFGLGDLEVRVSYRPVVEATATPAVLREPESGIEPLTYALRVRCSTG